MMGINARGCIRIRVPNLCAGEWNLSLLFVDRGAEGLAKAESREREQRHLLPALARRAHACCQGFQTLDKHPHDIFARRANVCLQSRPVGRGIA